MLPVAASDEADASRLLKSWGLKFDVSGRLNFQSQPDSAAQDYQSWRPDLSGLPSADQLNDPSSTLQPVVISSKQKKEN